MKSMSVRFFVFSALSSMSLVAWADLKSSIPASLHLHISPAGGWSGSVASVAPTASFSGFPQADLGRYFTITTGPEFINIVSGRSASFTGQLAPDRCRVADAPLPLVQRDWDAKINLYQKQTRQLHSCVQIRIHDPSGVRPAVDQEACQVSLVNDREAVVSGGVCFFQISPVSNFQLTYELNPECSDPARFAALQLEPLDISAFAGFYVSGDASGRSPNLKPLGTTNLRFSIEASEPTVHMSTDMGPGVPRWPVVVEPDVHIGTFEIFRADEASRAVLTSSLFAQNLCDDPERVECNFGFPLGSQFNLKEIRSDGRTALLEQWYSGGLVPAYWQGFLPATRELSFSAFKAGRRYRLEADLTYFSMYYRLFKENLKNYLISLGLLKIDPDQPLMPLQPIATIPGLKGLSPAAQLPNLQPLTPGGVTDMSVELNNLRRMVTDINWPPFYEKVCGPNGCAQALNGQARLKVGVDFTIDGFEGGKAKTSDLRIWRQSAFLPEYDQSTPSMMRPDCE